MEIRLAQTADIAMYVAFAREAQLWLQAQRLGQYVPAAHEEYAPMISDRVASGTLYAVFLENRAIGFFSLDSNPSAWWTDGVRALYLAGMVVSRAERGKGIGGQIIDWCLAEAVDREQSAVRLDCHAESMRLRSYYESKGFRLTGQIEQHPGYNGCLYERAVTDCRSA